MNQLQKILVPVLALGIIGLLIFFAFWVVVLALVLAPIAWVYNKFSKNPPAQQQDQESKTPTSGNTIEADYEVVKDEDDTTK